MIEAHSPALSVLMSIADAARRRLRADRSAGAVSQLRSVIQVLPGDSCEPVVEWGYVTVIRRSDIGDQAIICIDHDTRFQLSDSPPSFDLPRARDRAFNTIRQRHMSWLPVDLVRHFACWRQPGGLNIFLEFLAELSNGEVRTDIGRRRAVDGPERTAIFRLLGLSETDLH